MANYSERGSLWRRLIERRVTRVVGGVMIFLLVVVLLFLLLNWYIAPTKPNDKKDLVLALAQILGGTALLSGLYFTWRTLQVNRQGQITERFTRAIDQLGATDDKGNKLFEIRLGGIYALERIARESEDDYWPIMEILTTYVRQHAPRNLKKESSEDVATPSPDVQAILTVIGRRSDRHRDAEYGPINLQDTDLRGADLQGAYLRGADLAGADLRHASLAAADLQGAIVEDAKFRGTYLGAADLRNVYFMDTDLEEAVLDEADLRAADLSRATGLTQEQLDNALGDSHTVVPHNLQRPALWTLEIDEQRMRQRQLFDQILRSIEADQRSDKQSDGDE